jgi:hypothetical protein
MFKNVFVASCDVDDVVHPTLNPPSALSSNLYACENASCESCDDGVLDVGFPLLVML